MTPLPGEILSGERLAHITEAELLAMLAYPQFGDPSGPWCRWFAWMPVRTVDGRWVWLRHIFRRRYHTKPHLEGPQFRWWQYARADGYIRAQAREDRRGT